ncbi:MAG: hypothetical protein HY820_36075 [Acidobacteria bacterium]|nr:hypothetical protein [Acidobacteriota bacterium]
MSDAEVVRVSAPLVPVIVTVDVPVGVPPLAAIVIAVEPDPVIVAGLKLAVAPVGKPDAEKLTTPANPPWGVTVTV